MTEKFPAAQLFAPKSKFAFFSSQNPSVKDVNSQFPSSISNEVKCFPMLGTRFEEAAFLHVPSKTLILCDLAFNMGDVFTGIEKFVMKWNKVGGQFGPSRLTKLVFTKNRQSLVDSYKVVLSEDFDCIIVNHGEVIESGGKVQLRAVSSVYLVASKCDQHVLNSNF